MKKRIILAILALVFSLQAHAQTEVEKATRLQNGRLLIEQRKFALAMTELLPLTFATSPSAYVADASYLYAVAAVKQNKWSEAEKMLTQLLQQQPTWSGLPEAQFLLGQVLFEKKEYLRALNTLKEMLQKTLQAEVAAMKRHYVMQLSDKNTFQYLFRQFSEDPVLAKAYADKLVSGWYTSADRATLEALVRQFNLSQSYLKRTSATKKNEYNSALMLPFNLTQSGRVKVDKQNLFVTDFYAGVKAGQDSLRARGIKVNLFPYDTSNDTAQVRQVMELPELASMDLIIGPVFKTNSAYAATIAQERNLNMVNPFSDDLEIADGNPFLLMMEASTATQGQRAAAFAYQNFPKKTAAIIYDNTKNDTTFAGNFRRTYKALGGKVVLYQKINAKTSGNVGGAIGSLNLKDLGVLVVQASAVNVATSTVSYLEQRASKVPLLVPSGWLEMPRISIGQLDFLEAYFHAPKYVDATMPQVQAFKRAYASAYNLPPSSFSYAGFELMYYLGRQLQENGVTAPQRLGPVAPSSFYQGIGYQNPTTGKPSQDNQYVPVLKLNDGQLLVVNPVF